MKYGRIAGNTSINNLIYRCFEFITESDEKKFVKKFREQPHESDQVMHTFRELILGAHLSSSGFNVRYEYTVMGRKPDWCILDDKPGVIGIVELVNFHLDKATETEVKKRFESEHFAYYWRDQHKDNLERLNYCIRDKADTYCNLVKKLNIPYVISVIPDFFVPIEFGEFSSYLFDSGDGLFKQYPEVNGILYFEVDGERYNFNYALNPYAFTRFILPTGTFPRILI